MSCLIMISHISKSQMERAFSMSFLYFWNKSSTKVLFILTNPSMNVFRKYLYRRCASSLFIELARLRKRLLPLVLIVTSLGLRIVPELKEYFFVHRSSLVNIFTFFLPFG